MPYLARGDVQVHRLVNPSGSDDAIESVILTYGESIGEDEVPKYLKDSIAAGEVPLLEKVSAREADETKAEVEAAIEAAGDQEVVNASNAEPTEPADENES